MADILKERLKQEVVRRNIRYKIVLIALKNTVLSNRPRGVLELKRRIEGYLRTHPKSAMIISNAGISIDNVVSYLASHAN